MMSLCFWQPEKENMPHVEPFRSSEFCDITDSNKTTHMTALRMAESERFTLKRS